MLMSTAFKITHSSQRYIRPEIQNEFRELGQGGPCRSWAGSHCRAEYVIRVCVFGKSPASDVTGHTTSTFHYIKAMNMVITFPSLESDTCLNGAISISRLRRIIWDYNTLCQVSCHPWRRLTMKQWLQPHQWSWFGSKHWIIKNAAFQEGAFFAKVW